MDSRSPTSSSGGSSNSSSSSLLERVRARDPASWEQFVHVFAPSVYRWARESGLQAADAADIVQEVFIAVSKHIDCFRHDQPGTSFRAWLYTITRNKIHDHFRRCQARVKVEGSVATKSWFAEASHPTGCDAQDLPPGLSFTDAEHRAVEMVRAGIEPRTWKAFWLVVVEDWAVAEVADELGMSAHAVYDAKYRVTRKLRQELEGLI